MFTFIESSAFERVIYFVRYAPNEFLMLTLYAKAKRDDVRRGGVLMRVALAFVLGVLTSIALAAEFPTKAAKIEVQNVVSPGRI